MTPRVWIERPIESVEDAEALPVNAIAISPGDYVAAMTESYSRNGRKIWGLTGQDEVSISSRGVIGWTALVPVEAVEERERPFAPRKQAGRRRYITPWQET